MRSGHWIPVSAGMTNQPGDAFEARGRAIRLTGVALGNPASHLSCRLFLNGFNNRKVRKFISVRMIARS
jgi:hypothetical protein